jgi:hypothetical protein
MLPDWSTASAVASCAPPNCTTNPGAPFALALVRKMLPCATLPYCPVTAIGGTFNHD